MFSIIIPTFNNIDYLKLCTASLDKNSKYKHEIIFHINNGNDGTLEFVKNKGFRLINADTTIVAQAPKMAPHISQMREHIAQDCECDLDDINVKATTTEKLGFTGREEGIACHASVLLQLAAPNPRV